MKTLKTLAAAAAALAVAGCGSKLQCHDKVVAETLEGLVADNAAKQATPEAVLALFAGGGHIALSQTTERSRNESGALQCSGLLTANVTGATMKPETVAKNIASSGMLIELERRLDAIYGTGNGRAERLAALRESMPTIAGPSTVAWNIEYDAQRTSDGKDVIVNLQAANPIIDYVVYYAQSNAKVAKATPPPAAPAAPADEGSSYGTYSNDKTTITDDEGPHGGDELRSSLCANQTFKPKYDGASGSLSAPDGSYAISFGPGHAHIDVEGSNKCFPEGRYRKVR
ncbi:hypothetical protein SAMN04488038_10794 [Solimonas aquatica]|uniref:Lipoprotein n=1 Tax=Solimonas aquatica TaxID=489703 RepID=A0A1H9GJB1_9GAMM|nr:hypothetical protein [Solimonas aquatica]SEQ50167.1 hypothetical protein SAMN04488038_10794 [Solimonas aquatica]